MNKEKQQTALNYYRENTLKITRLLVTGEITGDDWDLLETELAEKAKEMEKAQIEEAELRSKEIIIIKHTEH